MAPIVQESSGTLASDAGRPGKPASRKRSMVLLLVIGSIILQFIPTWQLQRRDSHIMRDFADLYAAGTIVREGNASRLYDPALQLQVERERTMRPDQSGFLPYIHAPYEALLFAALSFFSYSTANWIWWMCNVALFFCVMQLLRPFLPALRTHFHLALLAMGAFFPLQMAEAQGAGLGSVPISLYGGFYLSDSGQRVPCRYGFSRSSLQATACASCGS